MSRQVRKNSFAEGALLSYIAIVLTKILGALYSIPFYAMIGEKGGFIYSCAYTIYVFFLDISTSGIPIALSILLGEYIALGYVKSKERAYSAALKIISAISLLTFAVLMLCAGSIAEFYLKGMTGGATTAEVAAAIRAISLSLLIVPVLAIERGYMQGHKYITVASNSQLIEQLIRIAVVLGGAYASIKILKYDVTVGICVAMLGAALGAAAALFYVLSKKKRAFSGIDVPCATEAAEKDNISTREIIRTLAGYCIVVIIISVSVSLYNIVDMKLLLLGLHNIGFGDEQAQVVTSVACTWTPKICNIITALSLGMVSSIAPHIADDHARGDYAGINAKLNQGLEIIMLISLPVCAGMIMFSSQVYTVFYGASDYGSAVLKLMIILNVVTSMVSVISMAMQSMKSGVRVCIALIAGILINLCLDLPLIYGFNRMGLAPYLGATVSSIIGQVITFVMLVSGLKKNEKISFSHTIEITMKAAAATAAMLAAVFAASLVWKPVEARSLIQVIQLLAYAAIGCVVYFPILGRLGAVNEVFGSSSIKAVIKRLRG